jgi:hypothetical protein
VTAIPSTRPRAPPPCYNFRVSELRVAPFDRVPGGTRHGDPRLTIEYLAAFLGVSENLIRRDIRDGKLHALVNINGTYSLTYPDVIVWLGHRRTRLGLYSDLEKLEKLRRTYERIVAGQSAA